LMFGYAWGRNRRTDAAPIMFAHRLGRTNACRKSRQVSWLQPGCQVSVIEQAMPLSAFRTSLFPPSIAQTSNTRYPRLVLTSKQNSYQPDRTLVIGATGRHRTGLVERLRRWLWRNGSSRRRHSGKDLSRLTQRGLHGSMGRRTSRVEITSPPRSAIAYAIGHPEPVSLHIDTFEPKVPEERNR
jgi:S-adenosylmethionine synthetase